MSFLSFHQVNSTDVSSMGHTEVVNLVRAAPRVVDLVVGRVLEAPKPPFEAHMLPDICFKGSQKPLGKKIIQHPALCRRCLLPPSLGSTQTVLSPGLVLGGGTDSVYGVLFVKDILPGTTAFEEGSLRPLDLIHYISGAPTQELTFSESIRLLELEMDDLSLKATR